MLYFQFCHFNQVFAECCYSLLFEAHQFCREGRTDKDKTDVQTVTRVSVKPIAFNEFYCTALVPVFDHKFES